MPNSCKSILNRMVHKGAMTEKEKDKILRNIPRWEKSINDLVSRQAAIDEINKYGSIWMEYTEGMTKDKIAEEALKNAKASMKRIINELPSEQPKTGKWIYDYDKKAALFFQQGWRCSACGRRQTYGESEFCMNCGAKMEHSDDYEERQQKLHEQILGREEDDA